MINPPLATVAQTQMKTLFQIREGGNGSLGSQVSVRSTKSSTTLLVTDDGVTGHNPEELEEAADNLEAVLDDPEAAEGAEDGEEEEEEDAEGNEEEEEEEDGREDDDA